MRAVVFAGAGGNEVIRVEDRPDPDPQGNEVAIRVAFAGLNPADVQQRLGNYPAPPDAPQDIPGIEVAGYVVAYGGRVTSWKKGDRVFGLVGGGGLASVVLAHERCLARIPPAVDDASAGAIPEAFLTAHDALASQAGLRAGETVLILGAGGGVGTAAVQIGVLFGARVLAAVRSERARECVAALGATPVDDSRFVDETLRLTDGAGVDVILDLIGGDRYQSNVAAAANQGRIIAVGVAAGKETALPLIEVISKRLTIRGTVLRWRSLEEKASVVRLFERLLLPALASERLHAVIDSVHPVVRVVEAFERLETPGKVGKVLVQF